MNVEVWSKVNCPQCVSTKTFLDAKGVQFIEKKIGQNANVQDLLELVPTAKSVPQIFIDGVHIGGYNELVTHFSE
jgi:glutaredoxin 3